MTEFRTQRLSGSFSFSQLGGSAAATLDPAHLSRPSLVSPAEDFAQAATGVHWGDCLRPHHFNFEEGTAVLRKLSTSPNILCHAVSVLGAGHFKETDASEPVSFENGGIIVKGGERYKFLTFETFRKHFVLEHGGTIETKFQIDYQTPKK
jgi:hypothetical protein